MEFSDFSQDGQQFKKQFDPTDNLAAAPNGNPDESAAQDDQNDPNEQQVQQNSLGDFNSPEELLGAYQNLQGLLEHKTREAQELGQLLDNLSHHAGAAVKAQQDDAFLAQVREIYDQDPVHAIALMMRKSQEDTLNDFDARQQGLVRQQQDVKRFMDDMLSHPSYSGLKPHANELAFLIHEHGVAPHTAAEIIRNVEAKSGTGATRRSDAAKAIRNRSMVESPGEVGEPVDKDHEFDKVLKKAKTLDEMFAGLRRLKL